MNAQPLELAPHLTQQHQHLLPLPPQHRTKQAQRKGLKPAEDLHQVPAADLLEVRVLGPRADGKPEPLVRDFGEARVRDPLLELGARGGLAARLAGCVEERVDPGERAGAFERAVFRVVLQVEVLELGPAAGDEISGFG